MPFQYFQSLNNGAAWYWISQPTSATTLANGTVYTNSTGSASTITVSSINQSLLRMLVYGNTGGWQQTNVATNWWETYRGAGQPIHRPPTMAELRRPAILRRENEQEEHRARRVLRRSIELYARVRGRDEVQRFVRGEAVVIQGHRFRYRVTKRDDLVRNARYPLGGHIPYHLELLDPANDNALASGCLVMDRTPVIDQVLALALNVQDREREMQVIQRTNWSHALPARIRLAA